MPIADTAPVSLELPEHPSPAAVAAALAEPVAWDAPLSLEVTYLDTFDWRLAEQGALLTRERDGGDALHWRPADGPSYVQPFAGRLRLAEDLPEGWLRTRLEPVLEVRALLPAGVGRVRRTPGRITDGDGNLLALLRHEEIQPLDEAGHPADGISTLLRVQPLPEGAGLTATVRLRLGATEVARLAELELAAAARGRRPGDYSSKPRLQLEPAQPAGVALRALLLDLAGTIRANVDGVIRDIDSEFLHDLRVAVRRSRSAVRQLGGVLPAEEAAAFADELKWLGTVTGPSRDLDVYLLEMASYRRLLGEHASALDPVERLLRRDRARALRRLRSALRSARFARLLAGWEEFLRATPEDDAPAARQPVAAVVGPRILKAHRRIVKRGKRIGDDPPAALLHRLRIAGKRLRYLLELFASLYPPDRLAPLVKELKGLQDILGGINDVEVQQARLLELTEELLAGGDARADTMLAMGRLAAALERRQLELRSALAGPLAELMSPGSRRRYHGLCGVGAER